MTYDSPFPDNAGAPASSVTPPEVTAVDEHISALVDGELDSGSLADLEQFAVDNDTTIHELSGWAEGSRSALGDLLHQPAPEPNRTAHLAAALDGMDEPEVSSLAAARASRRNDQQRAERLNVRLRRLTAVAAAFAVLGGVGVIALGSNGADDTTTEGAAAVTADASAGTLNRSFDDFDDEAASDAGALSAEADAMEESGEAMAESGRDVRESEDAMSDDAMEEEGDVAMEEEQQPAAVTTEAQQAAFVLIDPDIDLSTARLSDLVAVPSSPQGTDATSKQATSCAAEIEAAGIAPSDVVEAFEAQQSDVLYQIVVVANDELRAFALPDCTEID